MRYVWSYEVQNTDYSRSCTSPSSSPSESSPIDRNSDLKVDGADRVDFDECLLPKDSWVRELEKGEYEVEEILESRTGKKTRYGRQQREFLVQWKGHPNPSWVDEVDLNCGALLRDFERKNTIHNRFEAMQSHEN
ncbi:unnamed protein product [Peronospora effusa]|nr:unnamed protein product [Peronospora effusa]